jgi:hypothetical protein
MQPKARAIMVRRFILAFAIGMCASAVSAATIVCNGTVETLSFHANTVGGGVMLLKLSSMNEPVQFCDPNATFSPAGGNTVSAATCKTLVAAFMSAKLSGLQMIDVYFDGDSAPSSCGSWGAWQSASIRHFKY